MTTIADAPTPPLDQALASHTLRDGLTIADASRRSPVMLVFLRHSGCTFCKEALSDLAARRERIESNGTRIVLVHMTPADDAAAWLASFGLNNIDHISDPEKHLYAAMNLQRGTLAQLFGLRCFLRGIVATLRGNIVGKLVGDGFQMPGAFLIHNARVASAFRHASAADRPDYLALACAVPGSAPGRGSGSNGDLAG
jgi:peroxiredoxin